MVHVEGLDLGVGLTSANLLDGGCVVGNAVDANLAAAEVGVEEADVHRTLRLDNAAVGTNQRHVNGDGVLELGLSVALDNVSHGVDDVLTVDLVGTDGGALGEHALAGGHLDHNITDVGIALIGGVAYISNDGLYLNRRIGGLVRDILSRGLVGPSTVLGRSLSRSAFGLDGSRVLGGLLRRDGLGRNDDLLAVGQVGGGDGVLAAVVGGELRAGVGDGGNLLTVVRGNRKREVEGVGNVNGLGVRLGRDALLGAVLRAVLQRRGGDLNVEGDGGVGLLCGRLLGLGLVGLTVRSRRLGVLCRGLDGVLLRLGHRLLGIVLRGRLLVGGVGLLRGRHLPLGARVLGGRVHNDLVAALGPAGGQDVGERLDVGRLHHEDDAEEDRQYGLPPLLRLLTPEVLALMPLVHTNHSLNVLGTT